MKAGVAASGLWWGMRIVVRSPSRRIAWCGAEENETVRALTKYSRHRAVLLVHMLLYSEERLYAEKSQVATAAERSASCG